MIANRPKCAIKGCNNNAMSAGNGAYHRLCTRHHKKRYGMSYANSKKKRKLKFENDECVLCGWEEGPCDRHRIKVGKKGGKYVKGNVIILCPNCHRLLHLGLLVIK